jgi:hypothetical protein
VLEILVPAVQAEMGSVPVILVPVARAELVARVQADKIQGTNRKGQIK